MHSPRMVFPLGLLHATSLTPQVQDMSIDSKVVVIGTSAGGLDALRRLLGALPPDFQAPVLVVMHIGNHYSMLPKILKRDVRMPVRDAEDDEPLVPGTILIELTSLENSAQRPLSVATPEWVETEVQSRFVLRQRSSSGALYGYRPIPRFASDFSRLLMRACVAALVWSRSTGRSTLACSGRC